MIVSNNGNYTEAVQWTGFNLEELKRFVGRDLEYTIHDSAWRVNQGAVSVEMYIDTNQDRTKVHIGDYIVKKDTSFDILSKERFESLICTC